MATPIDRRRFLKAAALAAPGAGALRAAVRPNVLWLMTDEQRPDSLGCYGSPWASTPHLNALAASGTLFHSAYVPAPVCVACRSSLLTGWRASANEVLHNQARLRDNTPFLTWRFAEAGYQTASFGKKHYFVKGRQAFETEAGKPTDDHVDATRYGDQYNPADYDALFYRIRAAKGLDRPWILAGTFPAADEETAEWRNAQLARNWLSSRDAARPFFLRLSLNAPHTPVVTPKRFLSAVDPDAMRLPLPTEAELAGQPDRERIALRAFQGTAHLSPEEIRKLRHYYYARVAFLDHVIGELLSWMRTRGLLENTIVAFMSDHGSHLADHGMLQKQTFYEQVGTVPFLVSWPGEVPGGRQISQPVNVGSLLPTLLSLSGLHASGSHYEDLAPVLRQQTPGSGAPVFSEIAYGYQNYRDHDRQVMIRHGRHKMIVFQDPADPSRFRDSRDGALYDLSADPNETRNLFHAEQSQPIISRLTSEIVKWDEQYRPHRGAEA